MSEKTQQPTAKKLQDAQKKGQIPRSKLFTSAAVTLGGLAATLAFSDDTSRRFLGWTRSLLSTPGTSPSDAIDQGVRVLALCSAPSLAGAMGAALVSAVAMSGLQFNADVVSPKLERVDFTEGVKKLFSLRQLVDARRVLALLRDRLAETRRGARVEVRCHPADETCTRGPYNQHVRTLRAAFGLEELRVRPDTTLARGQYRVDEVGS